MLIIFYSVESSQSHHLVSQQQDCFQTEFAGAEVKQVLQTGAQQLHYHYIIVTFSSAPLNGRDSHCCIERRRNRKNYLN